MKKFRLLADSYVSDCSTIKSVPKQVANYEEIVKTARMEEARLKRVLQDFLEWLSKGHCIVEKDVVKVLYDNIRRNGNMPIKEGDEESIKERLTVLRTAFIGSDIDWDSIPEYD